VALRVVKRDTGGELTIVGHPAFNGGWGRSRFAGSTGMLRQACEQQFQLTDRSLSLSDAQGPDFA